MKQDESVALWRRSKDAWSAWAEEMLRQKAELEKTGTWNGDKPQAQWSDETRKWNEAAQTDLSGLEGDDIDFNGFVFPWRALFGSQLEGVARARKEGRYKGTAPKINRAAIQEKRSHHALSMMVDSLITTTNVTRLANILV